MKKIKQAATFLAGALFALPFVPQKAFSAASVLNDSLSASSGKDTLVAVKKPGSVVIIEGKHSISVAIKGKENNPDYKFLYNRHFDNPGFAILEKGASKWDFSVLRQTGGKCSKKNHLQMGYGLSIGLNSALGAEPSNVNVNMGRSWNFAFNILGAVLRREYYDADFDFGVEWSNYRMIDNNRFVKRASDKALVAEPYPAGAEANFSRLKFFGPYLQAGIVLPISKHWKTALRGRVNFNTRASVLTRYTDAQGAPQKNVIWNLHQNVTYSIIGELTYRGKGIYVKYTPSDYFDKGIGPRFQGLSVGVIL